MFFSLELWEATKEKIHSIYKTKTFLKWKVSKTFLAAKWEKERNSHCYEEYERMCCWTCKINFPFPDDRVISLRGTISSDIFDLAYIACSRFVSPPFSVDWNWKVRFSLPRFYHRCLTKGNLCKKDQNSKNSTESSYGQRFLSSKRLSEKVAWVTEKVNVVPIDTFLNFAWESSCFMRIC